MVCETRYVDHSALGPMEDQDWQEWFQGLEWEELQHPISFEKGSVRTATEENSEAEAVIASNKSNKGASSVLKDSGISPRGLPIRKRRSQTSLEHALELSGSRVRRSATVPRVLIDDTRKLYATLYQRVINARDSARLLQFIDSFMDHNVTYTDPSLSATQLTGVDRVREGLVEKMELFPPDLVMRSEGCTYMKRLDRTSCVILNWCISATILKVCDSLKAYASSLVATSSVASRSTDRYKRKLFEHSFYEESIDIRAATSAASTSSAKIAVAVLMPDDCDQPPSVPTDSAPSDYALSDYAPTDSVPTADSGSPVPPCPTASEHDTDAPSNSGNLRSFKRKAGDNSITNAGIDIDVDNCFSAPAVKQREGPQQGAASFSSSSAEYSERKKLRSSNDAAQALEPPYYSTVTTTAATTATTTTEGVSHGRALLSEGWIDVSSALFPPSSAPARKPVVETQAVTLRGHLRMEIGQNSKITHMIWQSLPPA